MPRAFSCTARTSTGVCARAREGRGSGASRARGPFGRTRRARAPRARRPSGSTTAAGPASTERPGATVIHEKRRGYGSAYLAGFRAARADLIVMVDADSSYGLDALPAMLAKLDAGDELVMGSRFQGHIAPGAMPWTHRYIGSP